MAKSISFLLFLVFFVSCTTNDDDTSNNSGSEEIQTGKITTSISVNGVIREYIIYLPESYSENQTYPLLFAFHGLGGNMNSSYNNSKFYELAEQENFIVVHPNGISSNWNAITVNNNRDIDFIQTLIDTLENDYSIDATRIYSCGMSNGGYFSFLLACELSDKIAAIGSVTGLMFQNILNNCEPTRPVPILQIHGTNDNVVDYANVENVLNFWINHNNTSSSPIFSEIPNIDSSDGSTVEKYVYTNGNNNVEVQHLKIIGGGHDWPGHQGNMDIDASKEVWDFLKEYDINGKIE